MDFTDFNNSKIQILRDKKLFLVLFFICTWQVYDDGMTRDENYRKEPSINEDRAQAQYIVHSSASLAFAVTIDKKYFLSYHG